MKRKIRVAQVITRLDWGGSPDIFRLVCDYLDPKVYDLKLIIGSTSHAGIKTREFLAKFHDRLVIIPELRRDILPLLDLAAFLKLIRLFKNERFDIVHTHTAKAGALGRIAAFLCRVPVIIHTPHGHNFYGYFNLVFSKMIVLVERLLAFITDKIIVLTELERNDYIRFNAAPSEKLTVIYQGLDLEKKLISVDKNKVKSRFNISPEENVVGLIARLEPVKGIRYFIMAASRLKDKNFGRIKFMIVGEGSERQKLEKLTEELELSGYFVFTGWQENIFEILPIFDIMVLSSLNEAVGMVLIEAQAQGVPIVATNVGGIPEIVKDKETGILVPAGNSQDLAKAIDYLLMHPEKRSQMSEAAKAWVRDKFRVEIMIDKITELYSLVLKAKVKCED